MQKEALASLKKLREKGEHRAIIVSATGTGKPAYPPHLPTCLCARGL